MISVAPRLEHYAADATYREVKLGFKDSKRIPEDNQGLLHQDCWQTIPKMENKARAGGVLASG